MAEKLVLIGMIPEAIATGPRDQVEWICGAGNLKVEFDPHRCPFSSNVFQAPAGARLMINALAGGYFTGSAWPSKSTTADVDPCGFGSTGDTNCAADINSTLARVS